jgi:hypothetical protein
MVNLPTGLLKTYKLEIQRIGILYETSNFLWGYVSFLITMICGEVSSMAEGAVH